MKQKKSIEDYGLYTFHMNAVMMVWFVYLLAVGSKTAKIVEERGKLSWQ